MKTTGASDRPKNADPKMSLRHRRRVVSPSHLNALQRTFEKLALGVTDVGAFTRGAGDLSIYIDETWPGPEQGVIAGIVWRGPGPNPRVLPKIRNHLHDEGTATVVAALRKLLVSDRCLPFVFPFHLRPGEGAPEHRYEDLIRTTLGTLLGWLLPSPGRPCQVRCIIEQFPGRDAGVEASEFFQGLLDRSWFSDDLFGDWRIKEVRWAEKQEGYLGYAHLLAYLTRRDPIARQIAAIVSPDRLPGYQPATLDLVEQLIALDTVATHRNPRPVLDFANMPCGAAVRHRIETHLDTAFHDDPDLQLALLAALEERYRAKSRDLQALSLQLRLAESLISGLHRDLPQRTQLALTSLRLQDANHRGAPKEVTDLTQRFEASLAELQDVDRELCAFVLLNLSVHYADRFIFDRAWLVIESQIISTGFSYLSPETRGRLHSSFGQLLSIRGRHEEADERFVTALEEFDRAGLFPHQREAEQEQTRTYRAINAMDGGLPGAKAALEAVTGALETAAANLAADGDPRRAYQHHALLRFLFLHPAQVTARRTYRVQETMWQVERQHPWELIAMYRGLLLAEGDAEEETREAARWFDLGIEIAGASGHGVTLALIRAMIAAIAWCCIEQDAYRVAAEESLAWVEQEMPGAAGAAATLRTVLDDPSPDRIPEALSALPFNYH